jgi:micrococcal nuclease
LLVLVVFVFILTNTSPELFNDRSINNFLREEIKSVFVDKQDGYTDETYLVTRVIDGDTIDVLIDGVETRVRYIGIDTPETVHPNKLVECFGEEASDKNKELVLDKKVRLVKDTSDKDKYGRLLRYVYTEDVFVNKYLIENGYANAVTYPPDVAFSDELKEVEKIARQNKYGLWGSACGN